MNSSLQQVWYPADTLHGYYNVTDYVPYAALHTTVTILVTGNFYFFPSTVNI